MKFKLVIASMSLLGLISVPAFADINTPLKICSTNRTTYIMDETTQNLGRSMPNQCNPGWFNRIYMSGGVNLDLGKWGNRNANFEGENYQRVSLNDAYINILANMTEWANGFVSLSYSNTRNEGRDEESLFSSHFGSLSQWDYQYSKVYTANKLSVEQAYATIGNFNVSPFYIQGGKEFIDFSRYEIHPITRSFTQVLSETLRTSAKIGFIMPNGLNGSIYAFDNNMSRFESDEHVSSMNYGAGIGYAHLNDNFGWNIGAGYLYNMIGVNDVAHAVKLFNDEGFHNRVSAVALYGDLNSGPFTLNARWTGALQSFNVWDLPQEGWAFMPDESGAKPWAWGLRGGFAFDYWNHIHNLFLGYESSHESAGIGLPKSRWLAGFEVLVLKNTSVGIEWDHDKDYAESKGGSGDKDNLFTIRTSVKFN